MSTFVGIDIAAKTVDLVIRHDNKNSLVKTFEQTNRNTYTTATTCAAIRRYGSHWHLLFGFSCRAS